jgi:uracil-DNA glycosylase
MEAFVKNEYETETCYPPYEKLFNALETTPLSEVKCVILGQDPYHEPNQAMGLSFSVDKSVAIPRSLQNIYKELNAELGCYIPDNGDLTPWAEQGVLLLNAVLSVRRGQAASHAGHGWENYTDAILSAVNEKDTPVVFMLWGRYARDKKSLITNKSHLILECPHPSPFSASYGFFGCGHFKKCNEFLVKNGMTPINWQIENVGGNQ